MEIKGVNLGNWLVLEKWMNTQLFEGTDAEDEYWLPRSLPRPVYEARIKTHRQNYISERDFVTMKSWGLNTIRIPVPYFIFGDREPFIGCIAELDKAFNWAERYGLTILIDLHTAPGGQNGFDNGGISGVCTWAQQPEEVAFVLSVLDRLAQRYGQRPGLFGIEVINEPILESMWTLMDVQKRYPPVDLDMAKGSAGISADFLKDFYLKAYEVINPHLGTGKYVVIHDGFELMIWKDFMQEDRYDNVILDTHQYLMVAEMMGCGHDIDSYVAYIKNHFETAIEEMEAYFPVICGEWCLFNSLACGKDTQGGQTILNGIESEAENQVTDQEKQVIYSAIAKAQLEAWRKGSGYFFWSYKLLIDTTNTSDWNGWDAWDMGRCMDFGWMSKDIL